MCATKFRVAVIQVLRRLRGKDPVLFCAQHEELLCHVVYTPLVAGYGVLGPSPLHGTFVATNISAFAYSVLIVRRPVNKIGFQGLEHVLSTFTFCVSPSQAPVHIVVSLLNSILTPRCVADCRTNSLPLGGGCCSPKGIN